jgi:hypothetical protein
MAQLQSIRIDHDAQNQIVWFSGVLADGHKFSVGLPIAHIQVTFDQHAASMGWCGEPLCGGYASIEGFFSTIKAGINSKGPASRIISAAHSATMQKGAQQAVHYATSAAQLVKSQRKPTGPRSSHALPAISAQGLAAMHAAHLAVKSGPNVGLQSKIRQMVANPTNPIARITVAALQSHRV